MTGTDRTAVKDLEKGETTVGKESPRGLPKRGGDRSGSEGMGTIWRESGEERHSRLGQRRCGWLYMMHAPATTNRPAFFECKVYIGKYKKVS